MKPVKIPWPSGVTVHQNGTATIDFTALQAPANVYAADAAGVLPRKNGTSGFIFGQSQPLTEALELFTVLIVEMPLVQMRESFMASTEPTFWASLQGALGGSAPAPLITRATTKLAVGAKSHLERATLASMGFNGYDAELSFFQISPMALNAVRGGTRRNDFVRPVVTVSLATDLLASVLEECKRTLAQEGAGHV